MKQEIANIIAKQNGARMGASNLTERLCKKYELGDVLNAILQLINENVIYIGKSIRGETMYELNICRNDIAKI